MRPARLPRPGLAGLAAFSLLAASGAAKALAADPRIRLVDYDPAKVVRVAAAPRTATQILFASDETILHVALGDSASWEVAADRNMLFLKPKDGASPTNLIVSTNGGSGVRHYAFELSAQARAKGSVAYALRFRYPEEAIGSGASRALDQKALQLRLERSVLSGPRNLRYAVQGSPDLQPSEVSDNGRFTVLRFPGAQPLPSLFEVGADGQERLTPFDVRGEFVVVHAVVRQLRLRRGSEVLCIYNEAFAPAARGLTTGTAAPDVVRRPRARP